MPATVAAREDAGVETGASFLVRLRSETRALHASTERRIAPAERLHGVGAYAALLAALYPLYASIEERLEPFGDDWRALRPPLDVSRRRRAHLLIADLAELGVAEPWRAGAATPELERFAQAFGALYVVEGSRLGGRVLARQTLAAIGAPAASALSFLRGPGTEVGRMWTEVRTALAGFAADSDAATHDDVIAGARETFRCFDRQLALWHP
jgi:heme oxygenase